MPHSQHVGTMVKRGKITVLTDCECSRHPTNQDGIDNITPYALNLGLNISMDFC